MEGKITLITPPDFYENSNLSILFVNLSDRDQDIVTKYLSETAYKEDINIYFYTGETNLPWFFYAMSRCEHKYIDLNKKTFVTDALGGYMLGKSKFFYKTDDENLSAVYSHINTNRIERIETFMESVFGGETN